MMKKVLFFAGLAAAVLSLVGCNKEADFFGRNGRKMQIVLTDAATRTVNDGLATKWVDGDALNVFYAPAGTTDYSANSKFEVDDAASNHATGTADLTADAYDWYLLYPYSSYIKTPANTSSGYLTLGSKSNATQSQNGLDDMAHLAGEHMPVYGVAKNVSATVTPEVAMKQVASVVAINLTNATDQPLKVDAVSFSAPEDIVGTYYIDFSGDALAFKGSGANYVSQTATLDVAGDETIAAGASAKFYLAIKPFAAKAGDELAVKVHVGELVFEKKLTLPSAVEFKSGVIKQLNISYTGGSVIQASTLEEIAAMDKDSDVVTGEVLVVAKYARGVMLAQNGFYLLAFDGAGVAAEIGDIVTVTGKVGEYSGLKQITSPVVEVISSDNEVVLPDPKVLEGLDEYESAKVELIQYSGTLTVSGNYYNVKVDGSSRLGSIQYPLDTDAMKALDKKPITATGFFTGISGSSTKYVNMMSTSVVAQEGNVFDVTPTQISVAATATTATINVTGNVDWTAEASDGASVDPTSGNGEGTITVSFPANTDSDNTKEYTVFVRTDAEGVNDEFEVNITQGKAVSGNYFVKVTASADLTDGLYLVVNEKAGVALKDAVDEASNGLAVTIANSMVEATAEVKAVAFTFTASDGAFRGTNGKYLAHSGTRNSLNPTDTPSANTVTFSDGNAVITAEDEYFLQYNKSSGQERFRYYKNAQTDGEVQLYKLSDGVTPPPAATLESIAVSGQTTVFTVGDTFAFDGKVTATYSDGSTKDVTASAKFSTPDLSAAGTQEVTVSYTENDVTKTTKYSITVKAAGTHAGTLEDPYSVADAMAATEALGEGKTSSDSYYTKGIISEIVEVSADYGNATYFISDDGTTGTQFKVFRGKYIGNINFSSEDQIKVGDEVVVYGKLTYYKPSNGNPSELEIAQNNYIYSLKRDGAYLKAMSAKLSQATVPATGGKVTVNIYGNVDWTATCTEPGTVDPSTGSGIDSVVVTIPENNTGEDTAVVVTIQGTGVETVKLKIDQPKKEDITGTVDILNQELFGVSGSSYTEFSGKTGASGAVYAGQCAASYGSIQLRSNNNNSGVVTTATGGKVKKVAVTWNENTASGRKLNIYGKNEAYAAATDLYDTAKQGTLLGTVTYGSTIEITVAEDVKFVGFRSDSGALYLDEVQITWE